MSVYIDTSAFIVLTSSDDPHHGNAVAAWTELASRGEDIFTSLGSRPY